MSRFNTPEEVLAWADMVAKVDYERNLPIHTDPDGSTWQVDKNPYSTAGARGSWQRGFDNATPYSWEVATLAFDTQYQRGRAMARLISNLPIKE